MVRTHKDQGPYLKLVVDNHWEPIEDWINLTWNRNVFSIRDLYINIINNNVYDFSSMLGKWIEKHNRPMKTHQMQTMKSDT